MKEEKLLNKIKNNPKSVKFNEIELLLKCYGFALQRQKGSHRIYKKGNILVNIQRIKGEVKPYQVKQVILAIEEILRGD
ncbi:MAG: type II toxin-antitoxin system HicA family toxin [Armatimonadota bacterium]